MEISGKTVAVTGAGGFIGARLLERLRERGATVRGLDLRASRDVVAGDVTNTKHARALCEGADVVIHTAAVVGEGGDSALYDRINVGGTRTITEASRHARFVQLSSVMVYGFTFPPDVTEEGPLRSEDNDYCRTKIESELVVREGHRDFVIVRPGDVYGAASVPWVLRPIEMMRKRVFAIPPKGVLNLIEVDDLVDGILHLIEKDATGEAFNLTGGVATPCREWFGELARMIGRRPPVVVPRRILRGAFEAIAAACDRLHIEPPARPDAVDFLSRPNRYSIEKARSVGYEPKISLAEGLARIASSNPGFRTL
ncbi:MAG: NAD-dependent epimerase/dehydratase family protein [Polyangiales bacterium]